MVAALAEQKASTDRRSDAENRAATRVYPTSGHSPSAEPETLVRPTPGFRSPAEDETRIRPSPIDQPGTSEPQPRPTVTRLPLWRRNRGRLAAVAAIIIIIIIAAHRLSAQPGPRPDDPVPSHRGDSTSGHRRSKVNGYGTATGQATARQDASGSCDTTLRCGTSNALTLSRGTNAGM